MSAAPAQDGGAAEALLAALAGFRVHDASPTLEPGMPTFVAYAPPEIMPVLRHAEHGAGLLGVEGPQRQAVGQERFEAA